MSMHMSGWYESLDPSGADTPLEAMMDERMFTQGDNIRTDELLEIMGLGVCIGTAASTAANSYLYTPTIDTLGRNYLSPLNVSTAAAVNANQVRFASYERRPLRVADDELMRLYINALPGAAAVQAGFIIFTDGRMMQIPSGRHITWRGTFVAPAASGVWSPVNVTWQTELLPGEYGVIGMQVVAPTTLAARLNTRRTPLWFPGVMVQPAFDTLPAMYQMPGKMGVWTNFHFTQPPTLEVCAVTPAAGAVYLDIVQLTTGGRGAI